MKSEKTTVQMRRGVLELCVLSIISDKEVYTSDIIEAMKDAELIVVEGTVYPLLSRLKKEGILNYKWEESTSGPPRKYYSLSDEGKEMLNRLTQTWTELTNSVTKLVKKQSNEKDGKY
ncbi:MAG: PadR family transcriptional regulator [Bacteroidales bacterium]|nr:PadR family transcriptional regulator [Bacteroidales bacterium]